MKRLNGVGLLIAIAVIAVLVAPVSIYSAEQEHVSLPSYLPLASWMEKLGAGESCPPSGLIDSNGTSSYGRYCYQANTFIRFVKESKMLPNAEDTEILNSIGDEEFQNQLTFWVFKNIPNAWVHWTNTVQGYKGRKGIGKPPIDP